MSEVVKCLVPLSGGKDSQASLVLALRTFPKENIRGLFCDTQFEHPITYAHIDWMGEHYGIRIDRVSGGSVEDKALKYGRFPGGGARHCTDELKIRETKIYCRALAQKQGGFEVWYGMRTAESPARRKRYRGKASAELYEPHEVMPSKYPKYLGKLGVRFRLPILEWSEKEVIDLVGWDALNKLYRAGFPRVGCFPCMASGDHWKREAFSYDDFGRQQFERVIRIASAIGKSPWDRENKGPGCLVCNE